MNEKQEKQFETKFSTAVILFAQQFQDIMESCIDDLSESVVEKFKANPNMSIEEMTKEIAEHTVKGLIKEFELQVTQNEVKS
ncbi:hypothetical protein CIW83_09715 [Tissierella sp. P1]|uniref:hypothetical protein n=1 Tax=Tissierella sp. P1 TaxID=1280483 RepID=UPI000BA1767E|nr:hypothetical protein [Tissierella sp. P1]OZV12364.1 hypothetical protein CIW83_09715 [Tissierella sp. P1]